MGDSNERTSLLFDPSQSSESELQIQPQSSHTGIQRKPHGKATPHYNTITQKNSDPGHDDIESNDADELIVTTCVHGTQSSLVTIFSLWNTMLGTSLLTMPWAISQAGFACGIVLMILIGGLSFYTTKQIVNFASSYSPKKRETLEFSDICRSYLGRWGDWAAFAFSLCAIFGALIVFYVLMSDFLYNIGRFIHDR